MSRGFPAKTSTPMVTPFPFSCADFSSMIESIMFRPAFSASVHGTISRALANASIASSSPPPSPPPGALRMPGSLGTEVLEGDHDPPARRLHKLLHVALLRPANRVDLLLR